MRKLLIFFLVGLFIFIGCESDTNGPNGNDDDTVTDIDGNVYQTVTIGTQVWMAENLKVTHYRDGTPIPNVTDSSDWDNLTTGAYCEYDNDSTNVVTYGRLYNWYAVNDSNGFAPVGWHVPTDEEWKILEIYLGMDPAIADSFFYRGTNQGSQLAGRADLWTNGVLDSDSVFGRSGFAALPGGYRQIGGRFEYITSQGLFWSSSEISRRNAWSRFIHINYTEVYRYNQSKQLGFSVRCVRD